MATIGTTALTLIDWSKRLDPNGNTADLVELLNTTNPILTDAAVVEGNLPTGHRTTVRTGLPTPAWRMLNYGVQPSKSTTVQVDDSSGMLEAYSQVDKDLANLNGNTASFRLSEDRAFIEGMTQEMASTLWYGNTATDPKKFLGLSPRYASLSAANADNIIDASGTQTDNTSIWLITWSDQTTHLIFPKGSRAGLQSRDLGEQTLIDAAGGLYQGYRSHYKWDIGLSMRDWRYNVRICNIDVSNLIADSSAANLTRQMIKATHLLPSDGMGKSVFYVNRTVSTYLDLQMMNATNVNLTLSEAAGVRVMSFRGIPIRRSDALLNTEARVV
jgi:hypothetical protein